MSSNESDYFSIDACDINNPRVFRVSRMVFLADIRYCGLPLRVPCRNSLLNASSKLWNVTSNDGFYIADVSFYNDIIHKFWTTGRIH